MENGCLISIIIPVFNVEPYLVEALDSVIHQTYENLEIIIIDDGSTDGSGKLCDEYAEKDGRILVVHQENKGLSNARNAGLNLMNGEAVAFLDPDDAYHPEYVSTMISAMIREKANIVLCRYTVHKTMDRMRRTGQETTKPRIKRGKYDRADALRALVDGVINVSVWNKLYSRELWSDIRFPDGRVYEDTDTTYKIINICRTVYAVDQPLYMNRKRQGSITHTHSWKNVDDRIIARSHFDAFVQANTPDIFTAEQLKKRRQRSLNVMFRLYIQHFGIMDAEEITVEDLKKNITEAVKEMGMGTCSLRTRAVNWTLCSCLTVSKIIYPLYRSARSLVGLVMGRFKGRKKGNC